MFLHLVACLPDHFGSLYYSSSFQYVDSRLGLYFEWYGVMEFLLCLVTSGFIGGVLSF